jgi:hypothetical protein
MGELPEISISQEATRRRARRKSHPVDVEFRLNDLTVTAVIRDVSDADEQDPSYIGIGVFHNDPLPLDEILSCLTVTKSKLLPEESTVLLIWTRRFGSDGFLSGGRMRQRASTGVQECEAPDCDGHDVENSMQIAR